MVKNWIKSSLEKFCRYFWLDKEKRLTRLIRSIVMLTFYSFFMLIFAYALAMLLEPMRYADIISNFGAVSYARFTLACVVLIFGVAIFIFPLTMVQIIAKEKETSQKTE
ncbi:MAG: hypothetical protein QXH91_04785 [Candidatus Bathyarchaeia archaeon]